MDKHLFISCFILFALNIIVFHFMFIKRIGDVRKGVTDAKFYKTYDIETSIPRFSKQLTRNFINHFETPVLFYAIIGMILIFKITDMSFIYLAYSYAILRTVHTIVHITGNRIYPRMAAFGASMIVLMVMWTKALINIAF